MKRKPLVTFVLLAYNQEQYIREAVEGAFSQTYEPLEIILSDDCSSDRTFEMIQEMAAAYEGPYTVRVRQNKVNLGLAGHINKCLALANGEIISWAAGDDISLPDKISKLTQPMIDDPEIMGVHSAVFAFDKNVDNAFIRENSNKEKVNNLEWTISKGAAIGSQAHAFRKKVFTHFGDLGLNVTHEGKVMAFREAVMGRVFYLSEPTIYYRLSSGTSNYRGNNLKKVMVTEPIKISGWYYFAIEQIYQDSRKVELSERLRSLIQSTLTQRKLLYHINFNSWDLASLVEYLIKCKNKKAAIYAFLRRNAPLPLKVLYVKLFPYLFTNKTRS